VFAEVELPTNESLARMEHYGVAIAVDQLQDLFEKLTSEVSEIAKQAFAVIGHEINLASPKQLQTVLFDELGMTGTKQVKTGFSTNAAALTELFEQTEHPFLAHLLEHREATKIRQIVETMLKAVASDGLFTRTMFKLEPPPVDFLQRIQTFRTFRSRASAGD
jgi:DNA polymerase-1